MLTRYLAVEGAPRLRVNALCPGLVNEGGRPRDPIQEGLLPSVPMGRVGEPGELVGAALYLASDASAYTTGAILVVNGGRPW
jgi:NAD(P)-dependent dehydrogenase (short-subunit alcohol dehydrogenase family)